MGKDNFIKFIIQQGIVSEEDALYALTEHIGNISLQDYNYLVRECKKNKIDAEHFFKSIYMNASEDAQYQMWKDGYVESCPANKLIADITTVAITATIVPLFLFITTSPIINNIYHYFLKVNE